MNTSTPLATVEKFLGNLLGFQNEAQQNKGFEDERASDWKSE